MLQGQRTFFFVAAITMRCCSLFIVLPWLPTERDYVIQRLLVYHVYLLSVVVCSVLGCVFVCVCVCLCVQFRECVCVQY